MFGLFGISLAVLGFGKMAKQQIGKSFETIDSRNEAIKRGSTTYVDGNGSTRWTENGHLLILSKDQQGYSCWYDIEEHAIIDRFGYRNHLKEVEKIKKESAELEKKRLTEIKKEEQRKKKLQDETRRKYGHTMQDTLEEMFYQRLGYNSVSKIDPRQEKDIVNWINKQINDFENR